MTAVSLGPALTLPILHSISRQPDLWKQNPNGWEEIPLRGPDGPDEAWLHVPQVRHIIMPMMRDLEIISCDFVVLIKINPGQEFTITGEEFWYEAIIQTAVDVKSIFEDGEQVLPPGSLWMWEPPMRRVNGSQVPAISMLMRLEAA